MVIAPVKIITVGGDLYLWRRSDMPDFGSNGLGKITVGGKVKVAKPELDDITVYYPIKSHGTTTAAEALKKGILSPKLVSAKSTAKGKIKLKWKPKNFNGTKYEIQYRLTTASGYWAKRNTKTTKVKNIKQKSVTLSKLKSGKQYEIRMRVLGKNGKKSGWVWFDDVKVK
jgi:hypothetical protein